MKHNFHVVQALYESLDREFKKCCNREIKHGVWWATKQIIEAKIKREMYEN